MRRRPSRLTGQPFRLVSKDPLPGARVEAAVGHGDDHGSAWRPMMRISVQDAIRFIWASALFLHSVQDRGLPQASLAGAVVQPALGPALADRRVGGWVRSVHTSSSHCS